MKITCYECGRIHDVIIDEDERVSDSWTCDLCLDTSADLAAWEEDDLAEAHEAGEYTTSEPLHNYVRGGQSMFKIVKGPSKLSHAVIERGDLTRAQLEEVLADGFGEAAPHYHNPLGWKLAAAHLRLGLTIDDTKSRWSDDGKILFLTMRYRTEDRIVGEQIRCKFIR